MQLTPQEKDKLLIELLTYVLEKGHYSPKAFDDNLSKGVYKDYIDALDPSKRYFLQSDSISILLHSTDRYKSSSSTAQ